MDNFYKKNPQVLQHSRFVMNEMDGNNESIRNTLDNYNFKPYSQGIGGNGRCPVEIWKK